jgi:hypothetical protein
VQLRQKSGGTTGGGDIGPKKGIPICPLVEEILETTGISRRFGLKDVFSFVLTTRWLRQEKACFFSIKSAQKRAVSTSLPLRRGCETGRSLSGAKILSELDLAEFFLRGRRCALPTSISGRSATRWLCDNSNNGRGQ